MSNRIRDGLLVPKIDVKLLDLEVVEGKKGFTDVKTLWTFILRDKNWRVANIEDNSMWLKYANLPNELPDRLEDVLSANKQITSG